MTPNELRQAIKDTGDTIANFADRIGITAGTLYLWLKGPADLSKRASNCVKMAVKSYESDPPTRIMFSGPGSKGA